ATRHLTGIVPGLISSPPRGEGRERGTFALMAIHGNLRLVILFHPYTKPSPNCLCETCLTAGRGNRPRIVHRSYRASCSSQLYTPQPPWPFVKILPQKRHETLDTLENTGAIISPDDY
mgnify:CR=1